MKSGNIFTDNDPHMVPPVTDFVQSVCGTCKKPISLSTTHQINGVASCWYCFRDHSISRNVCPCPYRQPKSRTLMDRTDQDLTPLERYEKHYGITGLASDFTTTVTQTEAFINDPNGGL